MARHTEVFLSDTIRNSLYGNLDTLAILSDGDTGLPSWFDVTGLSIATIGAACGEVAAYIGPTNTEGIEIDRALASGWFGMSIRPEGWQMPPVWDDIAGLYKTSDERWIRLHTNAPHHRAAALRVLSCSASKQAVSEAIASWEATQLETAIVEGGGCAAEMRSIAEWQEHPQGRAVADEPLITWYIADSKGTFVQHDKIKLLSELKVLDCTRVLAGPVCTRFLAGYGADVLRVDPPDWSEPNVVPEVTLGKRTSTLDLNRADGRKVFADLLQQADLFIHGYRPDALDKFGFGAEACRLINPNLIMITLNAYGWTGPWSKRRGYDSLVQMSGGIAHLGMVNSKTDGPTPLPVQALDHATGYLMAASAVRALRIREQLGKIASARLSLARTAELLIQSRRSSLPPSLRAETYKDMTAAIEVTSWGPARRLKFPVMNKELNPNWSIPARELHQDMASWDSSYLGS